MDIEITAIIHNKKEEDGEGIRSQFAAIAESIEGGESESVLYHLAGRPVVFWRPLPPTSWGVVKQAWADFVLAVKLWWRSR